MVAALSRDHPFFHMSMTLPNSTSTKVTTSKYRNAQKHCKIQYEITLLLNFKKKYSLKEREHICNKWRPNFGKKSLNVYCKTLLILPNPKKQKKTRENLKNPKILTLLFGHPRPQDPSKSQKVKTHREDLKNLKSLFSRGPGVGGFLEVFSKFAPTPILKFEVFSYSSSPKNCHFKPDFR